MIENAKPILFNGEMVRAILDGRKTETRRPIKGRFEVSMTKGGQVVDIQHLDDNDMQTGSVKPPYQKGDILYVRETWQEFMEYEIPKGRPRGPQGHMRFPTNPYNKSYYYYKADGELEHPEYGKALWRPSIHMPKEAARIFLKVTDVKVERLQDITAEDALNEGLSLKCHREHDDCSAYPCVFNKTNSCKEKWQELWDGVYKARGYGWNNNPWVWVIKFELISQEG